MFFASFGPPPENFAETQLKSLRAFIDLQGMESKKWDIQPHCPHCKCVLHTYDKKGAVGFRTGSEKTTGRVASPGFHHPDNAALPDCDYSFSNDPEYQHSKSSDQGRTKEVRKKNQKILSDPQIAQANEDVLSFLIQKLLRQDTLSVEGRHMVAVATKEAISLRGLDQFPWVLPYMQVALMGSHLRVNGGQQRVIEPQENIPATQISMFEGDVPAASKKENKASVHEVAFDTVGAQRIAYIHKGDQKNAIVPERLRICLVDRYEALAVRTPIRDKHTKGFLDFELSKEAHDAICLRMKTLRAKAIKKVQMADRYADHQPNTMTVPYQKVIKGQTLLF